MASAQYTGVSFDGVHSSTEWGLRLKTVNIGMPEAKTEYVDVPGMNGQLDLTEAQNGGIKYGMRTITLTFDARDCSYIRWTGLISRIAKVVQGKQKKIILDIDSAYYYYGRCHINTSKSNETMAEIVVECKCEPYKYSVSSTDEPWVWDTFSFIDGYAYSTADIAISTDSTSWQLVTIEGFEYNPTMTIISNAEMKVKYRGTTYSISAGKNLMYDIELYSGDNELYFQGTGTITIVHRGGII